MVGDSLHDLIAALSLKHAEPGAAYIDLRNSLIRYFQIKGDADALEAADAALDRVALKLVQKTNIDDLTKYSFGVARLIFLERLRRAEKDRVAQKEFYSLHANSPKGAAEAADAEHDSYRFFRECFNSLGSQERKFLAGYFTELPSGELNAHREKIRLEYNISPGSLRVKIFRLRQQLEKCLQRKLINL